MSLNVKTLSIKSLDDLIRCISLASLLEISGWPKPGNVHRTKNFENTRFEHFLAAITAIQPVFSRFCKHIQENKVNVREKWTFVRLGKFFKDATEEMMKWQKGGNVLLGHVLILAPLAAAASICLSSGKSSIQDFKHIINKIIDDTSVRDTIDLYEAIKACNPGGLGKIDKYDLNNSNSIKEIQKDKITLKDIFELSKDYDLISHEYSTGFNITLNEGLPYFFKVFEQSNDINIATVNSYLKILADHLDTLISRKSGKEAAVLVSKKALEIINRGGILSERGLKSTMELDSFLQEKGGKMNPGTTADIVAGVIFCALLFGLRF